jgi:hypothetical protein
LAHHPSDGKDLERIGIVTTPRHYKNWLQAYMQFTRDSESPSAFHFWTGVSAIAGALRRRVWIDMKKFQWTPNFYIILVGPPGVAAKSTSLGIGMGILGKVPGIKFGPESMTWQKLAKTLSEAIEYVEFFDPDLGEKRRVAMSCNTIQVGELGTFLRTDDDQLISFLIRMWEGQIDKFRHETVGGGATEIDNPWLNVIGATTPSWLKDNFPEGMIGGGLTSRIVFVYGDKKRNLIAYPDEVIASAEYRETHRKLIEDLTSISKLCGPYSLSSFARDWGRSWYADHNNPDLRPQHLSSDRYGGYIARKQTHIHKFAIILAAAKRDDLRIEEDDLKEAEQIVSDIEHDMIKVFDSIGMNDGRKHIDQLIAIVKNLGGDVTSHTLYNRAASYMGYKDFELAVKAAIHGNMLVYAAGKVNLPKGSK